MASAVQKITLSSSRDIPFNKLVLSQSNVRKIKAGVSIEDLADSIARRGLIQSLNVRPVLDADGHETGMFEVPAGGRRYRALELLVKRKRLSKTAPVPCVVQAATDILAEEVSLAENIERAPLHPLDQFRAFQAMLEKGMSEEAIAAAFVVSTNVVKQRLRLSSVAPALLEVYAEDGMTLEQLMAFTVSEDHDRQQQVWEAICKGWQKEPHHIRRMLTETTVRAVDKRAVFVGIDAYEAANGIVMRDLFETDDGGYLQDVALLDRLVAEKLRTIADEIAGEGWKWVEASVSIPYGATQGLRAIERVALDITAEEQATHDALRAELDRLTEEYQDADELPDEVDTRMSEIETAIEALDNRPVRYDPADIAIAGVFVSIRADGQLVIDRGHVRPEDERPVEAPDADVPEEEVDPITGEVLTPAIQQAAVTIGGQPVQAAEEEDEGIKPLPERLVVELTAYRTLALQEALASNPHVAMTALLHRMVIQRYRFSAPVGCMQISVHDKYLSTQGPDLADSPTAKAIAERYAAWKTDFPSDNDALWDWIAMLDETSRMALLAHCVSYGLNALYERPNPHSASGISEHDLERRLAGADRIARATSLDIVEAGWRPTVGNYLGRVTKLRILEAVREGAGERAAQLIDHLKKDDMAREAERLLADTGWLPEPLRLADLDGDAPEAVNDDTSGDEVLPAFLDEGISEDKAPDEQGPELLAAE